MMMMMMILIKKKNYERYNRVKVRFNTEYNEDLDENASHAITTHLFTGDNPNS